MGAEPSFVYFLHEEERFDEPSFWELYNALVSLGTRKNSLDELPNLVAELVHIYGFILSSFVYHLLESDSFCCSGLRDGAQLTIIVERTKEAFYCALTGAAPPN